MLRSRLIVFLSFLIAAALAISLQLIYSPNNWISASIAGGFSGLLSVYLGFDIMSKNFESKQMPSGKALPMPTFKFIYALIFLLILLIIFVIIDKASQTSSEEAIGLFILGIFAVLSQWLQARKTYAIARQKGEKPDDPENSLWAGGLATRSSDNSHTPGPQAQPSPETKQPLTQRETGQL